MSCQLSSLRLLHHPCPPPRWRLVKTSQVSCLHVISVEPLSLAGGVTSISTDFLETKPFISTRNPRGRAVRVAAVSDLCCRTTRPINSPHGNEPWSWSGTSHRRRHDSIWSRAYSYSWPHRAGVDGTRGTRSTGTPHSIIA